MRGDDIVITPEGTVRTPSASRASMHEFKVEQGRMLYRWIVPDGSALPDNQSRWIMLNAHEVRQYYYRVGQQARVWFEEQGFTQDRVEREAEAREPSR